MKSTKLIVMAAAVLALLALLAPALLPAVPASADPGVNGNNVLQAIGVDSSPEEQAMREALDAQWRADLAAAIQQGVVKGDLSAKALGAAPAPAGAASTSLTSYTCFPTCSETDARFLALAGAGLATLAGDTVSIELAAPRTATTLEIGIFDGDTGGMWDVGTLLPIEYTLYADPAGDGSGSGGQMGQWLGNVMPDNAWYTITITNVPAAQAPSGHYFYILRVRNLNPSVIGRNSFKVRTDGIATLKPQAFGFIAAMSSLADIKVIYPNYPALTPTTYNGIFDFQVYVPTSTSFFEIWDGDLDFGSYDLVDNDTDDPDTPNAPFLPDWAVGTAAVPEGVAVGFEGATGNPTDDAKFLVYRRSPSVFYEVIDPNGNHYRNSNPSGNTEWEQFRIDSDANVPADYHVSGLLPAGIYHMHIFGMDLSNLNAWRFDYDVVGVCATSGEACRPPLHPYLVGDYVWYDANGDGLQNEGPDAGIGGVVINLVNGNGEVLATTTTDANGQYTFEVEPHTYTVQVAPANFNPGGALYTLFPTVDYTADGNGDNQRTQAVVNANVLTYDFGYKASGSLGDTVWYDANSNGLQDAGEPGINGVTVYLAGDMDNDGIAEIKLTATTTTTAGLSGQYLFDNLPVGSFTVTVDPSTLPGGMVETYDVDGLGTLNTATVTLSAGQNRTDVDFGYKGTGSLGDTVWMDSNSNGVYEPVMGELGIGGVNLTLTADFNGDGIVDYTTDTTTIATTGYYTFTGLPAGRYTVTVSTSTLPAGLTPTYDLDGIGTPNKAGLTLGAGQSNPNVDFGYRPVAPAGTGTPGYWKNHPEAWPVAAITIGGRTYTRDQAISLMSTSGGGDKTYTMFNALVSAKLNVGIGNNSKCIGDTILAADAWMTQYPVGSNVNAGGPDSPWRTGEPLYQTLDDYNNGKLCAPHRN